MSATCHGRRVPRKAVVMEVVAGHELVGTRVVGRLPSDELVEMWTKVPSGVIKCGFVVEYRDLEPPRTGIFDGLRIVIDPDVGFEMQCFLLLHLFGHSVQWVAPSLEHKLGELQNTQDRERFMKVLHDYEFEAASFGMELLHRTRSHGTRSVVQRFRRDRLALCRGVLSDRPAARLEHLRGQRMSVDSAKADSRAASSRGGSAVCLLSGGSG